MINTIDFGIIIGPTAVGKTSLSIDLAKAMNAEIINGDSMQIYRQLNIGTAKIKPEEMEGVPHHLIDFLEPTASYSVADFQRDVREKIAEIKERGKFPLLVGGTGLYIQSVLYDYQFAEEKTDVAVRALLEERLKKEGIDSLYKELVALDPAAEETIHRNNHRRVIRALEVIETTGKTMSELQAAQAKKAIYNAPIIGLTMDREKLYERINLRVDGMMSAGLLEEVSALYDADIRNVQSVQAIGYKELYDYLDGFCTLPDAIDRIKQQSRRYAKRQLTWFRNKMDVHWFDVTNEMKKEQHFEQIVKILAGKQQ